MIKRIYKTIAVLACTSCIGFVGCNAGTLTDDISELAQNTIVDFGNILIEAAVDNAFNNNN